MIYKDFHLNAQCTIVHCAVLFFENLWIENSLFYLLWKTEKVIMLYPKWLYFIHDQAMEGNEFNNGLTSRLLCILLVLLVRCDVNSVSNPFPFIARLWIRVFSNLSFPIIHFVCLASQFCKNNCFEMLLGMCVAKQLFMQNLSDKQTLSALWGMLK